MAEISLRAYIKEIDDLVEHDQLDEAIAHCRRILEVYPKHLATYRLLGKAYLEAKRYGDAADIFQRVLSAVPDDFVSHIGMAIVREDEGNLDSAIWHMERAFETNPSNPAIQQELRRLIGNRDGIEPAKVRMTRGALARLYAQGELYPQAIAELRAALKDDPDRPDLQVLLSMMYWRMDQHVEAAEVGSQILEKLPFCRDANRIIAAIFQASDKSEEASTYHRRLAGIDPYAAFVESASVDPNTVDANSVRIDKLEWRPGQPMPAAEPGQPEWAASLGVSLGGEEREKEPLAAAGPSWLEELEKSTQETESEQAIPIQPPLEEPSEPPQEEESVEAPLDDAPPEDADIPGWMREAGWSESAGEAEEGPVSFSDDELSSLDAGEVPDSNMTPKEDEDEEIELAPAEIPGWVQEIAPTAAEEEEEKQLPNWLGDIAADVSEVSPEPSATPAFHTESQELAPPEKHETPVLGVGKKGDLLDAGSLPAWLGEDEPGATSTIITWLGDRSSEEPTEEELPSEAPMETPPSPPEPSAEVEEEVPDWMGDIALEPEATEEGEEHSWLAGVAEVAAQQAEAVYSVDELPAELPPEEVQEAEPEPEAPMPPEIQPKVTSQAPDWLQSIAEEHPVAVSPEDLEEVSVLPDEQVEFPEAIPQEIPEAPEWLQSVGDPITHPTPGIPEAPDGSADWFASLREDAEEILPAEVITPEEAPDLLVGVTEAEVAPDPIDVEPPPSEEGPDWLKGIAEEDTVPRQIPAAEAGPDWLAGIAEPETVSDEIPEGLSPGEDAPGWLEGIAEPDTEVDLKIPPPTEEAPDWLDGIAEEEAAAVGSLETEDEAIDWLREIATSDVTPETVPEIPSAFTTEAEPEPSAPVPAKVEADTTPIPSDEMDDDEIFEWLEDLAAKQVPAEEEIAARTEEGERRLPPEIEELARATVLEEEAFPTEPEESLDWLENLASQRGIDVDVGFEIAEEEVSEDVLPVEEQPIGVVEEEQEIAEAAQWLDRMATQPFKKPPAEVETLDWLKETAVEEPAAETPPEPLEAVVPEAPPEEEPTVPEFEAPIIPEELPLEETISEFEAPDWLRETVEETPLPSEVTPLEPVYEEAPPPIEEPEPVIEPEEFEPEVVPTPPLPEPEAIMPEDTPTPPTPVPEPEPEPFPEPEIAPLEPEAPTPIAEELVEAPEFEPEPEPIPVPVPEPEAVTPTPIEEPIPPSEHEPEPAPLADVAPSLPDSIEEPEPSEKPELEPVAPVAEVTPPPAPPTEETIPSEEPEPEPVAPVAEVTPPPAPPIEEPVPRVKPEPEAAAPVVEDAPLPPPQAEEPTPTPTPVPEPVEEIPVVEAAPPTPSPTDVPEPEPVPAEPAVTPYEPPSPPAAKPKRPKFDPAQALEEARQALAAGEIENAASHYGTLIKRKKELTSIIEDLRVALDRDPATPALWQVLGDAYLKDDQLQEAIEAYKRGTDVA